MKLGLYKHSILWIQSFLENRSQFFVVERQKSKSVPVMYGVRQGLVLGPCLFLCYINYLPESVKSRARLFTDDTIMYLTINSVDDCNNGCICYFFIHTICRNEGKRNSDKTFSNILVLAQISHDGATRTLDEILTSSIAKQMKAFNGKLCCRQKRKSKHSTTITTARQTNVIGCYGSRTELHIVCNSKAQIQNIRYDLNSCALLFII